MKHSPGEFKKPDDVLSHPSTTAQTMPAASARPPGPASVNSPTPSGGSLSESVSSPGAKSDKISHLMGNGHLSPPTKRTRSPLFGLFHKVSPGQTTESIVEKMEVEDQGPTPAVAVTATQKTASKTTTEVTAAEISPTGSSGSSALSADPSTISGQNEDKSRTPVIEVDSTNEDQLVCGDCSAQFSLSEIARFIQHKVRNTGHFRHVV